MNKDKLFRHPVFCDYACDEDGNVYSLKYGKIRKMKPKSTNDGYLFVNLWKNGEQQPCRINRFIWQCINGEIPDGYHIDHLDFNRQNNCIGNLLARPASENRTRLSEEGLQRRVKAVKKSLSKPVIQLDKQGSLVAQYPSVMEASRQTGIGSSHISACCLGKPRFKSAGGYRWAFK